MPAARRPRGLEKGLASKGVEQYAAVHAARGRALQRSGDVVGGAAGIPDIERHVDALVRAVEVADDRAQDGLGAAVQRERGALENRQAGGS
jgi:hypothetical protein